ncbi:hypothetical protein [Candidatus Chloroploca mongolica]|nr:hypothetical protein [Candidatus Chloroploca mongolica]
MTQFIVLMLIFSMIGILLRKKPFIYTQFVLALIVVLFMVRLYFF